MKTILTDEQCAAMDETHEFISLDAIKLALTPQQRKARAEFEGAMQAGDLRGLPTAFGELA